MYYFILTWWREREIVFKYNEYSFESPVNMVISEMDGRRLISGTVHALKNLYFCYKDRYTVYN